MSDILYQDEILDHYRDPRNFGEINKDCNCGHHNNPSCGDFIEMSVCVVDGKIQEVIFSGKGCAISMASASMLTEKVKGMAVEQVKKISYADIEQMLGISLSSARKKCAYLSLEVLKSLLR